MRRLVYLYVSNGSAAPDCIPKWNPEIKSQDPFAAHFQDEGFCYLFKEFIKRKLFDEIIVVIESNRSPGSFDICDGIKGRVVPHIDCLWSFMYVDDILWARGGWRSWFPFLQKWHDMGRWLLFYRAASNRGAWPFWDIVLDDLIEECDQDGLGRFYYPIRKPTNPELFFPTGQLRKYDLMIGASHIHDKKGQFKILPILMEYRKQFGIDLKCVMPGSIHHGTGTSRIHRLIDLYDLDIDLPGMVSRADLRILYGQTKLFVHLGGAGQNDRGPLEAMACGTPIALSNEQYHAPLIRYHHDHSIHSFHIDSDNPALAAKQINRALQCTEISTCNTDVIDYFNSTHGIEAIYPQYAALFNRIFQTPHKDRQKWFDSLLGKETLCH
jgi:glycosyltransferase involved in cell wall biosynthesis